MGVYFLSRLPRESAEGTMMILPFGHWEGEGTRSDHSRGLW